MPRLDQRLVGLADSRPPRGAGALIQRLENEMRDRPLRRPSPAVHPIRAMAVAATAILVFVGGVAVGHWAFGSVGLPDVAFGGGDRWITNTDISVLAAVVAGASGGSVLLVGALSLAWRWRRRRRNYRFSLDQGGVMEAIDRTTDRPVSTVGTGRTNRWLAIGLVLALAALAGLGAWLLVDNLTQTDYEAVIDDFFAAMNSGDGPGAAALFTEDGAFVDPFGLEYAGKLNITSVVDDMPGRLQSEITGDTTTSGAYVAVPEKALFLGLDYEGFSVVEFEGRLIKRWVVMATFSG